jgi:uncharacterized coiled-coil protein SlyX
VFVDKHTVRVMGYGSRPDAPRNMIKEKKKKRKNKRQSRQLSDAEQRQLVLEDSGLSKGDAKARAASLEVEIAELDEEIKKLNRQVAQQESRLKTLGCALRGLKTTKRGAQDVSSKDRLGKEIDDAFKTLHNQRPVVHDLRREVLPLRNKIKSLRQLKYDYDKYQSSESKLKAKQEASSSPTPTSTPSLLRRGCLDSAGSVNIDKLVKDIKNNNADNSKRKHILVPGGTDPGAHILFNTVPVLEQTLIKLQNRFEVLSNKELELEEEAKTIDEIRFPEPYQVTVQHIRHHGGLTKQARVRKKRISSNADIRKVHSDLANNTIRRASSSEAIENAQETRRNARTTLRSFEHSNTMKNLRRHTELQLRRTYDRVAATERKVFETVVNGKSSLHVYLFFKQHSSWASYSPLFSSLMNSIMIKKRNPEPKGRHPHQQQHH